MNILDGVKNKVDALKNQYLDKNEEEKQLDFLPKEYRFAISKDIETLEKGIIKTYKSHLESAFGLSIAMYTLYQFKPYTALGYKSITQYLKERVGMSISTASRFRAIGEIWYKNRFDLENSEFDPTKNAHKLLDYPKAKEKWGKDKAIKMMTEKSSREFHSLVVPKKVKGLYKTDSEIIFDKDKVTIDGETVLTLEGIKKAISKGEDITIKITKVIKK